MAYTLKYIFSNYGAAYEVSGYTGEPVDVVIPKEYNSLPVTSIGGSAFSGCSSLTSIEIPDNVTSIGNYAFYKCSSLMSVVIPDSVTRIGDSAFSECSSLTSVVIPDSVTSIGSSAFSDCSSLTSVVIGDGVTTIDGGAFDNCSSLTIYCEVAGRPNGWDYSSWNPSKCPVVWSYGGENGVTDDGFVWSLLTDNTVAIAGYKGTATEVIIPSTINGYAVSIITENAFYDCNSLTSVVIPSSVTSIGWYAFESCDSLTSVVIPDSVISIGGYAFEGCESLTSVEIGDSVTSIGTSAFENCSNLMSVVIPDSVTDIGGHTFKYCSSLTSVVIGDSVKSIGFQAFYNCSSLTSVVIGDSVTSIGTSAFEYCSNLTSVIIPDSVISIGGYAFKYCSSLTSVVIGDGVTSIGLQAFYSCDSLTSVYISDIAAWCNISFGNYSANPLYYADNLYLNNEIVTELVIPNDVTSIPSYAFRNCDSLTSVVIGDGVTTIDGGAFEGCSRLTSVVIPDSLTSIGDRAFSGCNSLTSVTINAITPPTLSNDVFTKTPTNLKIYVPEGSVNAYKTATNWSEYADQIYAIEPPYKLTYNLINNNTEYEVSGYTGEPVDVVIPKKHNALPVTSIGDEAFSWRTGLTSVVIPDSVAGIGDRAFWGCTGLTSVVIGDSVTSIGDEAFRGCSRLTSVVIPDSVTSIGHAAFRGCSSLTSLEIPDSVISIAYEAFWGCNRLTSVVIPDSVTRLGEHAFSYCTSLTSVTLLSRRPASIGIRPFPSDPTIYCFSDAIEKYKTATNWNTYADNFKADDMRLYFTMNSRAQKKYFASKEWVQAQGYDAAPAVYSPIEPEAGNRFTFDTSEFKTGHLYKVIIADQARGDGSITEGRRYTFDGTLDFIFGEEPRVNGTAFMRCLVKGGNSILFNNAYLSVVFNGNNTCEVRCLSGDTSYTPSIKKASVKIVEVK